MKRLFFRLTQNFKGFEEGTILLKGGIYSEGQEYFDITTEVSTGHSYSVYNVPTDILEPLSSDENGMVNDIFEKFFDENYKINKEILNF